MKEKHKVHGSLQVGVTPTDIQRGRSRTQGQQEPNMWDALFAKGAIWGKDPSVGAQFALDYFEKKGARSVLDVASGYGRDSNSLAGKFEVTGIDSSAEGIRKATESALEKGVVVRHVLGDVRMMPFMPESFDGVLCNGILSHLLPEERAMAVHEIERVLRRGGAIVVAEFSINQRPDGAKEVDAKTAGEKGTFREQDGMVHHYFRQDELQALFPHIKFEHVEVREEGRSNGKPPRLKWVLAGTKK